MKKSSIILLLMTLSIAVNAQNMLGTTYKQVMRNYNTNKDYFGWKEDNTDDGTLCVTYYSESTDRTMMCYFEKDVVYRFILAGDENQMASFAAHLQFSYDRATDTSWIDKKGKCKWTVTYLEGLAIFAADSLE
jgi:hypothetical protein